MEKRQKKDKKIIKKLVQNSHHFRSFFGVDLSHSLTTKKYFFIFLRFFLTFITRYESKKLSTLTVRLLTNKL